MKALSIFLSMMFFVWGISMFWSALKAQMFPPPTNMRRSLQGKDLFLPTLYFLFVYLSPSVLHYGWFPIQWVLALFLPLYNHQKQHHLWNSSRRGTSSLKAAFIGCLCGISLYAFSFVLRQLLGALLSKGGYPYQEQAIVEGLRSAPSPQLIFFLLILAPWVEEWFFRGYLQTWLKKYIGAKGAILCASAAFSLIHWEGRFPGDLQILLPLFYVGWLAGKVYEREKRLLAPFCLHLVFNGLNILTVLLTSSPAI